MTDAKRSVLVVSNRGRLTGPAFTGLFEFENLISEWENADLVTLPYHRGDFKYDVPRSAYQGLKRLHIPTGRSLRAARMSRSLTLPEDSYDLVVLVAGSVFDLFSASWLARSRSKFGTAIAIALEAWPPQIGNGPVDLEPFDFFDRVFIGLDQGTKILSSRYPDQFELLRPATNVLRYESQTDEPRPNLAVSLGRSNTQQTDAVQHAARSTGQGVLDDSNAVPPSSNVSIHRQNYAEMLSSADLMVCNYAKFDLPQTIGSAREIPMRFFEALAAGCIPTGVSPGEAVIRDADLANAVRFDLPFDGTGADVLEQLPDPDDWPALRRNNRRLALEGHDWSHRWKHVLASLDLAPTHEFDQRLCQVDAALAALSP